MSPAERALQIQIMEMIYRAMRRLEGLRWQQNMSTITNAANSRQQRSLTDTYCRECGGRVVEGHHVDPADDADHPAIADSFRRTRRPRGT